MKGLSFGLGSKAAKPGASRAAKPAAAAVFAADSDDEEAKPQPQPQAEERPAKRGRWDTPPG